ncbi:MAG: hypothetical protein ABI678_09405 [Kofleriaceae bacterium]
MRGWLVVMLLAGGGCFGEDHSSGGPYVPLAEVESATRTAECQYLARCHLVSDEATCLQMHDVIRLLDPFVHDYIERGEARYRGEQMAACLDQIATQSCEPDEVANRTDISLCVLGVVSGTLHAGGACTADVQCISQLCSTCGNDNACCIGTCVGDLAPARFAVKHTGDSCTNGFGLDDCDPTSYCDVDTSKCVPTLTAGTGCNTARQCDAGLTCGSSTGPAMCQRLPRLGEACTSQCGETGTYCSAQGSCVADAHANDSCTQGQQCDPFSACDFVGGTCKRGPALHEGCPAFTCNDFGTYCSQVSQRCELQGDVGEPCQENAGCTSGYCGFPTGVCAKGPECEGN